MARGGTDSQSGQPYYTNYCGDAMLYCISAPGGLDVNSVPQGDVGMAGAQAGTTTGYDQATAHPTRPRWWRVRSRLSPGSSVDDRPEPRRHDPDHGHHSGEPQFDLGSGVARCGPGDEWPGNFRAGFRGECHVRSPVDLRQRHLGNSRPDQGRCWHALARGSQHVLR